jgi:UDP-N-acetylmuramoylalanine--D-glutamate ligase
MRSPEEEVIFLSPSVRKDRPELVSAQNRGILLSSDAELFFERRQNTVIGVTGSDGKSTTTKLISDILNGGGIPAVPCGNFGPGLSRFTDYEGFTVCELSSFQLNFTKVEIGRAVITNITPNHLNWHLDLDEYVRAKLNIIGKRTEVIADVDSPLLSSALSGRKLFCAVSLNRSFEIIKELIDADHYMTVKDGSVLMDGEALFDLKDVYRKEEYNIRNYLLALGATFDFYNPRAALRVLKDFRGLPHRAEVVAEQRGVKFINSSIDTTPERAAATLSSLEGPLAVILGGLGKGLSPLPLMESLIKNTVGAVLMGPLGYELEGYLSSDERFCSYPFVFAEDMASAIDAACALLGSRCGTVILSPAGTSFDKYENYMKRGEDFRRLVSKKVNN